MNKNQSKKAAQQRRFADAIVYPYKMKWGYLRPYIPVELPVTLVVFIAIAFVLGACTTSSANELRGTVWELASLSESDLLPGASITIEFTDDEVSGSAGCNHYGGSYQISGNNLTISDVFATEMACPEPVGVLEQEGNYLMALNVADSYMLTDNELKIRDEAGEVSLLFVKPDAGSISLGDEPLEQPDESETVFIQNETPAPTTEPTLNAEVNEETPSQTVEPPPGNEPGEDTTEWVSLVSDAFPIRLRYPADWQYIANADNSQLNMPYVRGFSQPNETLVNQEGCAIYVGFGGGAGPTQTLTNDLVTIDGREFTKRTWYEGEKPIFIAFLPSDNIPDFELLFAWVSESNETGCIQSIDAIIGSIEFTGTVNPEVNEEIVSQTVEPPPSNEPNEDTTEWASLVSDAFPISLSYPADWQYLPNADNSQLNLPYVRSFSQPNETLVSQDGCAIYIGFGGGSGPTQTLTNDLMTIDGRQFTKRTWYEGETLIFISFLPSDNIPDFELLFAWVSESNETGCIQSIDAIIRSIEFTGTTEGG